MLRRPRLPGAGKDAECSPSIALRSIDGNLTRTASDVYAWYRLPPQRWSFRSDSDRSQLITTIAGQYAELAGRWLHLRVTARPFPVEQWARAHAANAVGRLPDVAGAVGFDAYLAGEQGRVVSVTGDSSPMTEKEVYLGVQVQARTVADRLAAAATPLLSRVLPSAWTESLSGAELASVDTELAWLDQVLSSPGLAARPVTPDELAWLLHRSCSLGLPAPAWRPPTPTAHRGPEDLAAFTDPAAMYHDPYAPTVTVRGCTGANAGLTRHVAVLSVGQMDALRIPEAHEPWMQRTDRVGSVEVSARIYVCKHEEVYPGLTRQMSKVRSQVRHYEQEHELEPPRSLARQARQVLDIEDHMTLGFTAQSARVRSWWRLAVSAETESDTLGLARRLCETYKPQIAVEHPEGQYALAREFIPGEPLASGVHLRRGSVMWAAAAVPQATAAIGDRRGVLLGRTAAATTVPVTWDPWMAQELRDSSGLTAVLGSLGSGKTYLCGGVVYKTLRAGARWDVLDPSGQLTALCELPELKPYARAINLLDAQPGILNPYRVVAEPVLADYADDPEPERAWARECAIAAATRRRLIIDVLSGLLPYEVARMSQSRIVLMRAVRAVGGRSDAHPGQVFDALRRDASEHREHAVVVADFLDEMRDRLALLIPESDADPYASRRNDRLTVLTMNGLILPKEGVSREHWTD
ncbi:MAG: ATPase, partial [Actinobacteria bacterium]|nr:ATPase [Actinomycetota bacterium]